MEGIRVTIGGSVAKQAPTCLLFKRSALIGRRDLVFARGQRPFFEVGIYIDQI